MHTIILMGPSDLLSDEFALHFMASLLSRGNSQYGLLKFQPNLMSMFGGIVRQYKTNKTNDLYSDY